MRVPPSRTRSVARAALALCCVLAPPCAGAQEWSRFEWVKLNLSGKSYEKAALFLPARIGGADETFYLQLDTALYPTLLYEVPYAQALKEKAGREVMRLVGAKTAPGYAVVRFEGSVGGVEPDNAALLMKVGYGTRLDLGWRFPKIGSAGLDLYVERPLILDFRNRRFAVLPKGAALPEEVERRAAFFPVGLRDGKLFVPVTHGGEPLGEIFYDTGTSAFNILTRALWQQVTGRKGDEPDNRRVTLPAWGQPVTIVGAKTKEPLRIGTLDAGRAMVYFRESGAENVAFEKWPFKADGLVGNVSFYDDHTVVIDLPRGRMGVYRSGKP